MTKPIDTNLKGSEKQVAWAEEIRAKMAECLSGMLEDSRKRYSDDAFEAHKKVFEAKVWAKLEGVTDAKWFIDHRGYISDKMTGNDKVWLLKLVSEL